MRRNRICRLMGFLMGGLASVLLWVGLFMIVKKIMPTLQPFPVIIGFLDIIDSTIDLWRIWILALIFFIMGIFVGGWGPEGEINTEQLEFNFDRE